jgi:hypothetical protein
MSSLKARHCKPCSKRAYSMRGAFRAALRMSASVGRPFRVYPCPTRTRVFHVTQMEV